MVSQNAIGSLALQPDWPLIVVPDPLPALQALARWQRKEFFGKVLAITGSNGKTIVKDALRALLARRQFLASPGNYNSQLVLPLASLSAGEPGTPALPGVGRPAPGGTAPPAE